MGKTWNGGLKRKRIQFYPEVNNTLLVLSNDGKIISYIQCIRLND